MAWNEIKYFNNIIKNKDIFCFSATGRRRRAHFYPHIDFNLIASHAAAAAAAHHIKYN